MMESDTPVRTPHGVIPPENVASYHAMKMDPSISYIVTCAFLFYVFMCAALLETLVGYNLRRYINTHEYIKHMLGLVVLIFTIGMVTSISNLFIIVVAGALVYIWFLAMTKMPGQWNILVLLLLMVCFILNAVISRVYTPEWVYSTPDGAQKNKHEIIRERLIYAMYAVGLVTFLLSVCFIGWFHSDTRKRAVQPYMSKMQKIFEDLQWKGEGKKPIDLYHWAHAPGGLSAWRESKEGRAMAPWGALKEWVYQPYSVYIGWNGLFQSSTLHTLALQERDIRMVREAMLDDPDWVRQLAKAMATTT